MGKASPATKTPAQSTAPAEDKTYSIGQLQEFFSAFYDENPELVLDKYWDAYENYLWGIQGYDAKAEVAESMDLSRGTVYKYFDKIEQGLAEFIGESLDDYRDMVDLAHERKAESDALEEVPKERIIYLLPRQLDFGAFQPRNDHTPSEEIVADIERAGGNRTPVIVREKPDRVGEVTHEIIGGHIRAAAIARVNSGLSPAAKFQVKAVVVDVDDKTAALDALRDNMFRRDLTLKERDAWLARLVIDYGWEQKEIAEQLDMSPEGVSNIVRAFRDTIPEVRELLDSGTIAVGHAKVLASLDEEDQKNIARRIQHKLERADEKGYLATIAVAYVQDAANELRNRAEAREKISAIIKEKKNTGEVLQVDSWDGFLMDELGTVYEDDYKIRHNDIMAAGSAVGVTVLREEPEPAEEPAPSISAETVDTKEKKEHVPDACRDNSCIAFARISDECALGLECHRVSCDLALPSRSQPAWTERCPFCGGLTIDEFVPLEVETEMVSNDHTQPFMFEQLDGTYRAHFFCVLQQLVDQERLVGVCATCQNSNCEIPMIVRDRRNLKLEVKECDYLYDQFDEDLKELDATIRKHYNECVADFKAEQQANKGGN